MGAWGPGLYSDDVTEDVRGIYVDKLHRGKNGEQASKEMIAEFEWDWSDEDDAPVFWFAMADMQWNYGRLQEEVKKKALYYLDDMKNLQRWEHENPKMVEKRKRVLNELREPEGSVTNGFLSGYAGLISVSSGSINVYGGKASAFKCLTQDFT